MKHEVTSFNTKKTLAESLKNIMRYKTFSKITVSEIAAGCGVNRKTFYYHFDSTYALLKWMLGQEIMESIKYFTLIVDYREALRFVMDYIEENDYIINCACDAVGCDGMEQFFSADFHEIVSSIIETAEKKAGETLSDEYKAFLCSFYSKALAGIFVDWIKNRKTRDREQVMEYLVLTVKKSLAGILDKNG